MSNDYFQFRQFRVRHDRCAMKVGTDGTLLGAWALAYSPDARVLDLGCGTGLIALMMAQRYPQSSLTAIDIDADAVCQARQNAALSPFARRIEVMQADAATYAPAAGFDAIVSNPPYFVQSLHSPDSRRTTARHADSLSYGALLDTARRLLRTPSAPLSLIIPADCRQQLMAEASLRAFFLTRECAVRTTPAKPPRRYLIELRQQPVADTVFEEQVLEQEPGRRSAWYQALTSDFYIR